MLQNSQVQSLAPTMAASPNINWLWSRICDLLFKIKISEANHRSILGKRRFYDEIHRLDFFCCNAPYTFATFKIQKNSSYYENKD